jgi:hypothetical protein
MSHRASQDRPFRARNIALLVGVLAVSIAARTQTAGTAPAPQAAAATATTDSATPADSTAMRADSAMVDTMAMDSTQMQQLVVAPAPVAPAAPTAWPVDPVTGQTLINGIPVVGRVFIMQKTDGTRKIESVAQALEGEAHVAAPAITGTTNQPAGGQTRRVRTVMTQATLWSNDHKARAVRNRHYGPTTSGASLGRQP